MLGSILGRRISCVLFASALVSRPALWRKQNHCRFIPLMWKADRRH